MSKTKIQLILGKWLKPLRKRYSIETPTDLKSWRKWLLDIVCTIIIIAIPVSAIFTFPVFIRESKLTLIVVDIFVWLLAIICFTLLKNCHRLRGISWIAIIYFLTIIFFITLGPHYARSAYLVFCAVFAALMFGTRAAWLSTGVNIVLLMACYLFIGPENPAWGSVYAEPFGKWLMFVVNVSIIALGASLSVGFLLNRLDHSLRGERESHKKLAVESKNLKTAYNKLKEETTRRKSLEERLYQAQKLEAIGTLARGVAHDFNNILATIVVYSELIKSQIPEGPGALKSLDKILEMSDIAKGLIGRIYTFSRERDEEKEPMEISSVVCDTLEIIKKSLPQGVEITTRLGEDPGIIETNPTQIQQLLWNLCTNSIQAMDGNGGVLEVGLSPVDLDDKRSHSLGIRSGPYLKISVKDTGQGIEPKVLKRIFEPYFTTKEKGVGTGLGMAVVHGIVQNHNGAITIDSTPGKGTLVEVYFPRVLN